MKLKKKALGLVAGVAMGWSAVANADGYTLAAQIDAQIASDCSIYPNTGPYTYSQCFASEQYYYAQDAFFYAAQFEELYEEGGDPGYQSLAMDYQLCGTLLLSGGSGGS